MAKKRGNLDRRLFSLSPPARGDFFQQTKKKTILGAKTRFCGNSHKCFFFFDNLQLDARPSIGGILSIFLYYLHQLLKNSLKISKLKQKILLMLQKLMISSDYSYHLTLSVPIFKMIKSEKGNKLDEMKNGIFSTRLISRNYLRFVTVFYCDANDIEKK